jgi:hypothetical protein
MKLKLQSRNAVGVKKDQLETKTGQAGEQPLGLYGENSYMPGIYTI